MEIPMTIDNLKGASILVVGAGIMGAGIAQVAAQAGHRVLLHDARDGAAQQAKASLAKTLDGLVAKGKLDPTVAHDALARIVPIATLDAEADVGLVIEAIVEKPDAKRALFAQLESIVGSGCVLATNTSSISVTAIANGLKHPARLVGMHFFNPVPLMKLVEVVSGLQTDATVAQSIFDLSKTWGKTPVHAKSTPGFIVNRIARPYYAEALALLQEQAATPQVIDACLRGAGFRMGPCELMDLIGHDTNFGVTNSVFEANFFDKRYMPSLVQREMVDGGLLGRKSGRGFFDYAPGAPKPGVPVFEPAPVPRCAAGDRARQRGGGAALCRRIARCGRGVRARHRERRDRLAHRYGDPHAQRRPRRERARRRGRGVRPAACHRARPGARLGGIGRRVGRVARGGAVVAACARLQPAAGGGHARPGGGANDRDADQ